VLLAVAVLAAKPIPTQVFTATLTGNASTGSMVNSASAPADCQLFEDEKEVLASITTSVKEDNSIMTIEMTTVSPANKLEKHYKDVVLRMERITSTIK